MVQAHAHGGALPEDDQVFGCSAYAAGNCKRAGALVLCAFHDLAFDWRKARDWQPVSGGGYFYAPKRTRRNGKAR